MIRVLAFLLSILSALPSGAQGVKPRARELGIEPGTLPTGPLNTITDVAGVRVGQTTVQRGDSVRTGVSAIVPHGGNLFLDRVPAAIHVGNGFGKLLGVTQVAELGDPWLPRGYGASRRLRAHGERGGLLPTVTRRFKSARRSWACSRNTTGGLLGRPDAGH